MDRVQSDSVISECKAASGGDEWHCRNIYKFTEPGGWLDPIAPPFYNLAGTSMLQIQSVEASDGLHYHQLVRVNSTDGVITPITSGTFSAEKIIVWDEDNHVVYFLGPDESLPGSRHLYSASVKPPGGDDALEEAPTCLTCTANMPGNDQPCERNTFIFLSPDYAHYIQVCGGPSVPETVLRRTSDHEVVEVLEDNHELRERLADKALGEAVFEKVSVGSGGFTAPVKMLLPPGFDASQKYPVLVYVYGGPGSQRVDPVWGVSWDDYLSTNYGVVCVCIDGRGSGFQSTEYLFQLYHTLGTVEVEDQIAVTRQLLERFQFLDASRVGIWGWSYGGYATLMTLATDVEDVFKCGEF